MARNRVKKGDLPAQEPGGPQRQELDALQSAAPLNAAAPTPFQPVDVFAPTDRPNEPVTAGAATGPGVGPVGEPLIPDDPDALIRAIYARYPHPSILRLLNDT